MHKKQLKNSRRNIKGIWKMWRSKNAKRERSNGENCQEDLQQRNYTGGQTSSMTKNTGEE